MPPKGPHNPEGGPRYRKQEADIRDLGERFGIPPDEAEALLLSPMHWMERMKPGNDESEAVHAEVIATTDYFENAHGPAQYWDDLRIAMAAAFIATSQLERAVELLVRAHDTVAAIDHASQALVRAVRQGNLGQSAIFEFSELMDDRYARAGRRVEFVQASLAGLGQFVTSELLGGDAKTAPTFKAPQQRKPSGPTKKSTDKLEPIPEVPYDAAVELYPHAPWVDLGMLVDEGDYWPDDMGVEARLRLIVDFGVRLSDAVADEKIERKKAEAIKAFIAERQDGRGGEAWDRLRLMAALGMYDRGGAKFGRILARSMDDPEMMAMVVHALIERERDADAMDVMQDIPDPKIFGKMLALGMWQDRAAIQALIEDLTVAGPKTQLKHDPQLRLGVAQGLHELYAGRAAEGDATWADEAEKMRKRAELLQRQIENGYIKAPRKK